MRAMAIIILLGINCIAYSQVISDPIAKKTISDLRSKYEAYSALEASFELNITYPQGETEVQEGILIQQGEKFMMDATAQGIYCDGDDLWVHLKANEEVQINDYDEEEEVANFSPKAILSQYDNGDYDYAVTNEKMEAGKLVQQIEFKPKDKDSEFSKVRMNIDIKSLELLGFKVFSKDGSQVSLTIQDVQVNKSYPNNIFTFNKDKYPKVHIEDLRID